MSRQTISRLAVALWAATVAVQLARAGLVGRWTFDEGRGRVEFTDRAGPIDVPLDDLRPTADFVHTHALGSADALYYRVKLLP